MITFSVAIGVAPSARQLTLTFSDSIDPAAAVAILAAHAGEIVLALLDPQPVDPAKLRAIREDLAAARTNLSQTADRVRGETGG